MYRDSVVADSDRKRSSTSAASTQSALDRDLDERITRPASSLFQSFSPPTECCKGQMVVFAILPLRYAAPFPLINPGRPQFCFAFHARDYPRVAHPSEGGVQRTLTIPLCFSNLVSGRKVAADFDLLRELDGGTIDKTLLVISIEMKKTLIIVVILVLSTPILCWALYKPIRVIYPELIDGISCNSEGICVDDMSKIFEACAAGNE
jgi:hypothetical protein